MDCGRIHLGCNAKAYGYWVTLNNGAKMYRCLECMNKYKDSAIRSGASWYLIKDSASKPCTCSIQNLMLMGCKCGHLQSIARVSHG